jgi:hypothetical protein
MKPRVVLFATTLVIVSMFTGCGTTSTQGVDNPIISESQAQEKEKNISKDNKDNKVMEYEIIRKVSEKRDSNTKIFYPQISGYKGQLLMDYMNQSLEKIVHIYGKGEMYQNISIDYKITKMDKDIISVLFKGTGRISNGREINIQQSVNLDVKSSNEIVFKNFVKDAPTSVEKVMALLNQKAKTMGSKYGVEAEGIRIFFEGENVVFYYMPADDSAKSFVEISVPVKELESFLNHDFEKPAS